VEPCWLNRVSSLETSGSARIWAWIWVGPNTVRALGRLNRVILP
jgi:hypothetical protein